MRNNGTRGYMGYRGRRSGGKRWLVLVLVLILLAAAAFLLAQRYMVYDMDGSYHFELPWFRNDEDGAAQRTTYHRGAQDLEIVIEKPEDPRVVEVHAQELDASLLQGGMSRALSELDGTVNAVAIRLKTADGDLLYPSALSEAAAAKAVAGSSVSGASVKDLTGSGYHTIARLSALHDSRYAFAHMTDAAVEQKAYKNYIWYAPDSSHYLAPEKDAARQYLCNVACEVAELGFDELLFDEFGYPTKGRLNNIKVSERTMSQEEALALLAANLREALSEKNVVLSLEMDEKTVLDGADAKSGQDLAELAGIFDRIYVVTTAEKLDALRAALAPYPAELVPILSEAPAEGAYLIPAAQDA